jgi:hypothetical protein
MNNNNPSDEAKAFALAWYESAEKAEATATRLKDAYDTCGCVFSSEDHNTPNHECTYHSLQRMENACLIMSNHDLRAKLAEMEQQVKNLIAHCDSRHGCEFGMEDPD